MNAEAKVGIFVTLGLVVLLGATLWVEDFHWLRPTYTLSTTFSSVTGLPENAVVTVGGLKAGRVTGMRYDNGRIRLLLRIERDVPIRADSVATLTSDTIVGSRYVNITLGSPESRPLEDGDEVPSRDSVGLETALEGLGELVTSARDFFEGLGESRDRITERVDSLIDANAERIREIIDRFGDAGTKAGELMDRLSGIAESIAAGEGTLGKLVKDDTLYNQADQLTRNLAAVSVELATGEGFLARLVRDPALYDNLDRAVTSLTQVSESIRDGTGTLARLVADDEIYVALRSVAANFERLSDRALALLDENREGLGQALESLARMGPRFEAAMGDLNQVLAKINQGEGSLAQLVNDPELYNEAKRALTAFANAMETMQDSAPVATFTGVVAGSLR